MSIISKFLGDKCPRCGKRSHAKLVTLERMSVCQSCVPEAEEEIARIKEEERKVFDSYRRIKRHRHKYTKSVKPE